MAEKQKDIELKQGMSKITKTIALLLLLIIAAAGGYWWSGQSAAPADESTLPSKAAPIYYDISAPFIVNFSEQSNEQVRYLQIKMKVMARQQSAINAFAQHEPAIVHDLLMLFYSQNYDDLNTSEGTQALQQATLSTINDVLTRQQPTAGKIEAVYFTSLVMQ